MLQVAEQIREIVSLMLARGELSDPRIKNVSITSVRMTADLQSARIQFSMSGDASTIEATSRGLRQASGYIRKVLGTQLQMRYTPELQFFFDKGMEHASHIHQLLSDIKHEDAPLVDEDSKE